MHLYIGWDDCVYLTEEFDGEEGHCMEVTGSTTVADLGKYLDLPAIGSVVDAYMNGANDTIEVFI